MMNIVIWGTGNNAENFYRWMCPEVIISGVVDGDCERWGGVFHEHEIKSIKEIDLSSVDLIAVCSLSYDEIKAEIQSMGISEKKIVIAVAECYADRFDYDFSTLRKLLTEQGIKWFFDRIVFIQKRRKYKLIEQEIIRKIEEIEFDTEHYPLSCYDFEYSPEVEFVSNVLDYAMHKYRLQIIYNNCFGYETFLRAFSAKFMFQFGFVGDCYPLVAFMHKYVSNINCSIDVGANTGHVALFLSQISKEVHAFEPSRGVTEIALKSVESNGINNIKWNVCGCGDADGEKEYYDYGFENSGHNSLIKNDADGEPKSVYKIPVTTLDHYCIDNNIEYIDLLKLDAEGYEPYIIKGCRQLLEQKRIKMIFFEVSVACIEDWEEEKKMLNTLLDAGFKYYNLYYENITIEQIRSIKLHQDIVAIRSDI